MSSKLIAVIALVLGASGLVLGIASFLQAQPLKDDLASLQENSKQVESAARRIGVAELEPALPVDQPNVARDPSIVPAPITRTEPTTVSITLTIEEVVAELADGATYSFWTFDGTVPGPMLRVMQGDTIEMTLVNVLTLIEHGNFEVVVDRT